VLGGIVRINGDDLEAEGIHIAPDISRHGQIDAFVIGDRNDGPLRHDSSTAGELTKGGFHRSKAVLHPEDGLNILPRK
jgi:hypothetical protein